MPPSKADYVKRQSQTRPHTCHWPDCPKQVPPAKWGCPPHWFTLPFPIRTKIWKAYRPGQEIDMRPSPEYLQAVAEADAWAREYIAKRQLQGRLV